MLPFLTLVFCLMMSSVQSYCLYSVGSGTTSWGMQKTNISAAQSPYCVNFNLRSSTSSTSYYSFTMTGTESEVQASIRTIKNATLRARVDLNCTKNMYINTGDEDFGYSYQCCLDNVADNVICDYPGLPEGMKPSSVGINRLPLACFALVLFITCSLKNLLN